MAEKRPTRRKFLRNTTLTAAGALMGAFSTTGYSSSPQKAEDISRYNPKQNGGCAVSFGYDVDMPGTDTCNGHVYLYDRSVGWPFQCGVVGHLNQDIREYINLLATRAEDAGVKLQFFLEGNTFEKPEDVAHWKAFAKRGHAIDSHMYYHDSLINTPADEVYRQVKKTKNLIETELGQKNLGLRGPGGYRNALRGHEDVQRAILKAGIEWVSTQSSQYADDPKDDDLSVKRIPREQPFYYETGLLEIPFCGHQDRSFFDADMGGSPRPVDEWIAYLKRCVDIAREKNLFLALVVHPSTSFKHDREARYLKEILAYCRRWPDIIVCTYRDMYRWISNDKAAYS